MPVDKPVVSVIIPSYGSTDLLVQTLSSVFHQTGNFKLNVVVIDDHSQEPIKKKIQADYPEITVIRNRTNLKSGPSRNQGLKKLNTDYIAFLDADDIWSPSFLKDSIRLLTRTKAPGTICLSSPLLAKDLDLSFKLKIRCLSLIRDSFQLFFYFLNNKLLPQSAFYLCQLSHLVFDYQKVKQLRFDSDYNFGGEDWKYALEVMDKGGLAILPKRLVSYRYHKKSATQKKKNLLKKWQSYNQLFGELQKRKLDGIMTFLFSQYINIFKNA